MSAKDRKVSWTLVVAVALTMTALLWASARTKASDDAANTTLKAPATAPNQINAEPAADGVPPDNPDEERVEAEVITLRPGGFEPAEITRPRGSFILAVNNRSGSSEVALQLVREAGDSHAQAGLRRGMMRWTKELHLAPGTYVLTDINHPEKSCRITITQN
jgi:hypothetical protein